MRKSARAELELRSAEDWISVPAAVARLPRTRIISQSPDFLHAECRSRWAGFVDDLTINRHEKFLKLHSASRVGLYDFGANRKRLAEVTRLLGPLLQSSHADV